ncbi:Zn(2)-C6 fungal-type transcriptional factor [Mycena indigotica]|uniref:Zn(2)-C6 fungal-type transcriptional factor n=1 Tax=Mycena indigotica TaxID=2126181 RepID=A0A8H6W0Z1_9AGAR|nr:Zn(2)-C6 fungal-type transcriptional factor [Mycena indigotica]KAF7299026.1 Zn(2)-C6 fungal-type transcriptional factor [Mycena indigotica]
MLSTKPKKPPACDSCKAKRVLCHSSSTPNGPCPRCVEKGILCKTTYTPRGRPKKSLLGTSNEEPSHSTIITVQDTRSVELSYSPILTPDLVKHLFKCFLEMPEKGHPIFYRLDLEKTLIAASWRIDLLPPQVAVLVTCMCCVGAHISWSPSIIGPGPHPESLTDSTVFFPGADLRSYGERRAPVCRMLVDNAVSMACMARIMLEPSEMNMASCLLLETLQENFEQSSRPWASAYISHLRAIAPSLSDQEPAPIMWASYLMAEGLRAAINRKPVLVSYADQLFFFKGPPPPPLDSLLDMVQQQSSNPSPYNFKNTTAPLVFSCIRPFVFHTTQFTRDFYEQLLSDFARRTPPSETMIVKLLSTLSTMQSLISYCLSDIEFPDAAAIRHISNAELRSRVETFPEIRSCAFAMTVAFASLSLTLHRELEERAMSTANELFESTPLHVGCLMPSTTKWAQTRMASLRQQAYELVCSAVPDLQRILCIESYPLSGNAVAWSNLADWAKFLADEADSSGGIPDTHFPIFERLGNALKFAGYSQVSLHLDRIIDRLDSHIAAYCLKTSVNKVPELFLQPERTDASMSFLLDGSWMMTDSSIGM